jgi:hypothetical protein
VNGLAVATLISVSIILLVALIALGILRRQSAALRHWVLAVAIACACASPLLSSALPPWLTVRLRNPQVEPRGADAPSIAGRAANDATATHEATVHTELPPPLARRGSLLTARTAWRIWLLGSVAGFAILLVGLMRLRWLASHAREIAGGRWHALAGELRRSYGIARPVRLLESHQSSLLVTWGWRRPTVLLPVAARRWSDDRVRAVLAH